MKQTISFSGNPFAKPKTDNVININKRIPALKKEKTTEDFKDLLDLVTEDLVNLFYEIETCILNSGCINLELGKKLKELKSIYSKCKIALGLPDPEEIIYPPDFADEYTGLLSRANKVIEELNYHIKELSILPESNSVVNILKKNLLTVTMLYFHYIYALGLP